MPKFKKLSEFEYGKIIGLYKFNLSIRNIATILSFKKSTVQDVINKYKNHGLIMATF
jgi:transposase